MVAFVKYLAGSFQSLAAVKGIQLRLHSEKETILVTLDKDQMQTILSNLLVNAVKFTPENGSISLTISCSTDWQNCLDAEHYRAVVPGIGHEGPWATIAVRDSGIGIPADLISKVFEQFYQISNAESRQGKGSGIGLALVKELVLLMQGGLAVKSEQGKGAEFLVILPVSPAGALKNMEEPVVEALEIPVKVGLSESLQETTEAPNGILPDLLIIEDNADVLHYIRLCVGSNYRIRTAVNGQEGIEKALKTVPDLIISDVMMPLKDGFEVVQALKNDERTSHIPIILLTAKADLDSRIKGLERGADAYLAKPFDKEELLAYLRSLLELRRKLQARYTGGALAHEEQMKTDRTSSWKMHLYKKHRLCLKCTCKIRILMCRAFAKP
ncbi:MAG: response regulator [Lewinellaceae bacterium]|nr:response regulator [Lewinellaceae bacterium]